MKKKQVNKEKTETELILEFLHNLASDTKNPENSPLNAILSFINEPSVITAIEKINDKLGCKYEDYIDYFWTIEDVENLIALKETDYEKYYTIIYYENILLNMLTKLFEIRYTIVLNFEDIYKSYLLELNTKN